MQSGELWLVFMYENKELCAYTLRGTFDGEAASTKEMLAAENGIAPEQIMVKTEWRQTK